MRARTIGLGLVALALLAAPAAAQKRDDQTLRQSERTLQQTQKQIREERARAAEARQREVSLLSELEAIELTLAKKRREIDALGRRIVKAQGEIQSLERDIRGLETQRAG